MKYFILSSCYTYFRNVHKAGTIIEIFEIKKATPLFLLTVSSLHFHQVPVQVV